MTPMAPYRRPYPNTQPPDRFDPYASTVARSPRQPLVALEQSLSEVTGLLFGPQFIRKDDNDLTAHGAVAPTGQRIVVRGRVLDENGRPLRDALIEVWQANAAGRYRHLRDQWNAPLDPNFVGEGRTLTDDNGRYRFLTIRPVAYPWAITATHRGRRTSPSRCSATPICPAVGRCTSPGRPAAVRLDLQRHARRRLAGCGEATALPALPAALDDEARVWAVSGTAEHAGRVEHHRHHGVEDPARDTGKASRSPP